MGFIGFRAYRVCGVWGVGPIEFMGFTAQTGEPVSVEASRLYETLAVTLQRENARAVLRRVPASGQDPGPTALFAEP